MERSGDLSEDHCAMGDSDAGQRWIRHIQTMMATNTAYSPASGISARALIAFLENNPSSIAPAAMVTTPETISSRENIHGVKNKPRLVGMVACIIMAPEILASAKRSLPCRTQITAF